VLEYHTDETD